jgi:hypothetical protein
VKVEESIEAISGRKVLNIVERIYVYDKKADRSKLEKYKDSKRELVKHIWIQEFLHQELIQNLLTELDILMTINSLKIWNT